MNDAELSVLAEQTRKFEESELGVYLAELRKQRKELRFRALLNAALRSTDGNVRRVAQLIVAPDSWDDMQALKAQRLEIPQPAPTRSVEEQFKEYDPVFSDGEEFV